MTQPSGGHNNTPGRAGFGPQGGQPPQWPAHQSGSSGGWSAGGHSSPYGWQTDPARPGSANGSVYRGFGTFEEPAGGGKPPGKTNRGVIGVLALVIVLLGSAVGLGIYYGTSRPAEQQAAGAGSRTTSPPRTTPGAPEPRIEGWQVGYNSEGQLAYDVPGNWNVLGSEREYSIPSLGDVTFHGLVDGPYYDCGGKRVVGGRAISTTVKPDRSMSETAEEFLLRSGRHFYTAGGSSGEVSVNAEQPRDADVEGFEAVRISGTVEMPETSPCLPTEAEISALVVQAKNSYVVLVVSADSERPASSPPAAGERTVPRVLDSARPVR
ncbi:MULTISPECIES: hypothetical protein [unclassified Actinopolyspora]|uniref:hypothetical protein n=1 Tax=unclassified Actinopolyspora TaxID=2639451 RepID=UPI001F623CEB|nr:MULTISPECIES: hypothetical protein [unclassified Actinopolyspora]